MSMVVGGASPSYAAWIVAALLLDTAKKGPHGLR
jgi:hypothetical protein